jgi:hypothetical protein
MVRATREGADYVPSASHDGGALVGGYSWRCADFRGKGVIARPAAQGDLSGILADGVTLCGVDADLVRKVWAKADGSFAKASNAAS